MLRARGTPFHPFVPPDPQRPSQSTVPPPFRDSGLDATFAQARPIGKVFHRCRAPTCTLPPNSLGPLPTHLLCQVQISGWRRALQAIGRITIGTVIVAGVGFYYVAHQERTPGLQLPHDPTKKTLVVLGSGWGATSFLKKLDTTDYNVVGLFTSLFSSPRSHLKSGGY